MTIANQLMAAFPKNVNKSGAVFSAIVANGKDAAIESVLKAARDYVREYISTPDVYQQRGDQLEKTVNYFSFLERFDNESEESLKQRFSAIFRRSGDVVWGNPHNVRNVFREYFPSATIYLLEGTNDITDNLIVDGDFEEGRTWVYDGDAVRSNAISFSKSYCLGLGVSGNARQTIMATPGKTYSLHWFQTGSAGVSVCDQSNRWWNGSGWQVDEFVFEDEVPAGEWKNLLRFVVADDAVTELTITFRGTGAAGYIDYVQLYEKRSYHSFTIIAHFVSGAVSGDLALAPGNVDEAPIEQEKYDNYGYYSSAYMTGVKTGYAMDIYRDLLEYVRSTGVRAYLNICNQDYKENGGVIV